MGVIWYLVNLTKGGYVEELGKVGEFDFQKEYDRLAGNSKDTFAFICDDGGSPYILYPFKTPFPSKEFTAYGPDIDEVLEKWEFKNTEFDDRKIKLSNGKVLNLDEDTRDELTETPPPQVSSGQVNIPEKEFSSGEIEIISFQVTLEITFSGEIEFISFQVTLEITFFENEIFAKETS